MKSLILGFSERLKALTLLAIACLLWEGHRSAYAEPTAFTRIIVFGDSLSDTGNMFQFTGGLFPPAPYADGRFSNGPLWIEDLAADLGMQIQPGDNYAVGGAMTGDSNSNDGKFGRQFPGLQDEIASFQAAIEPARADPDALYVLWAGANDFFAVLEGGDNPTFLFTQSIPNTIGAIQTLRQLGARHLLVPNVPDLGLTPEGVASGQRSAITQLAALYNHYLAAALDDLADHGSPTIRVDAFATLQAMVSSPDEFGFTNTTVPLLNVLLAGGHPNPAEFVFWDPVHPTTRAHEVLENEALNSLIGYFSPNKGHGTPDARVNALKGLTHAAQH